MKEPITIDELKQWYIDRNLPPENVTRFFIGKNYTGPKAFGIYFDESTGDYIVYKNKADGTRAIRYQGENEIYAVNELYKKLKDEIYNQKMNNPNNYNTINNRTKKKMQRFNPFLMLALVILVAILICALIEFNKPKRGYYNYDNDYYYYQNGSWYQYSDYGTWMYIIAPKTLKRNFRNYYSSYDYSYAYGIDDFSNSKFYEAPSSSSSSSYSSSSSDYDWDSGSDWDSDFTDWDSDW